MSKAALYRTYYFNTLAEALEDIENKLAGNRYKVVLSNGKETANLTNVITEEYIENCMDGFQVKYAVSNLFR